MHIKNLLRKDVFKDGENVVVWGTIEGDITVHGGTIILKKGSLVRGNVVSNVSVLVEPEAQVEGSIRVTHYLENYGVINGNVETVNYFNNYGEVNGSVITSGVVTLHNYSLIMGKIDCSDLRRNLNAVSLGEIEARKETRREDDEGMSGTNCGSEKSCGLGCCGRHND